MTVLFQGEEIFKMAVQTEEIGCEFYKAARENASNIDLKDLFGYLAREEIKHKEIFEKMIGSVVESAQGVPVDWDEVDLYIKSMMEHSLFVGKDKSISMSTLASDEKEAVDYAIQFEKDTLLFFYQIGEVVKASDKPAIQAIINEEKKHIKKLVEMKKKI